MNKQNQELNRWNVDRIAKRMKGDLLKLISKTKQNSEIIVYAKKIDWRKIIQSFNVEVESLINEFKIPNTFYEEIWLITAYKIELLKFLKKYLYYLILFHLTKIKEAKNEFQKRKLFEKMMKHIISSAENLIWLFKIELKFYDPKWIKYSDELKTEIKSSKRPAEHGKKFLGKKHRKSEIEAFNKIEAIVSQSEKEGLKKSYRSVAFFIGRTKLEMHQDIEQEQFYKRYMRYRKKIKK